MQLPSQPPFDFPHLIDVQPLLSTARDGDFALTIDSIERYEHGFVLVMWVAATTGPLHLFAMTMRDDVGNIYAERMVAGHGGGGITEWTSRVVYSFFPPLDPAALALTLTVTHVLMDGPGMHPKDILGGPWTLTFDVSQLPAAGREAAPSHDAPAAADAPFDNFTLPQMVRNVAHRPEGFVPPPRFEGSQLRRVIPVVQQQEIERFAITMLSLELYTDGFSAIVRTDYPEPSMHLPHQFHWQAEDDLGGRYWPRGAAGTGGALPHQTTSWRIDCLFTPPLNPEARQLRLWFDDPEFSGATFGIARPTKTVAISGRWEFTVAL